MFNLLYVVIVAQAPIMAYLGNYNDLPSCQNAIHEIFATRFNIPGQRNPELEKSIQKQMELNKEFLCVPMKKG
jgi:hypothetical protein